MLSLTDTPNLPKSFASPEAEISPDVFGSKNKWGTDEEYLAPIPLPLKEKPCPDKVNKWYFPWGLSPSWPVG